MNNYKELQPELIEVCGLWTSLLAMRLPKGTKGDSVQYIGDNDKKLAKKLIKAGTDHAKFQRGIIAYIQVKMQAGFMIEFETYRHGIECLSTSSAMHGELVGLSGIDLANKKQSDLPGKVYTRILTMSYQALRSIYKARRWHRHPDWQIFCDFIEHLPHFDILILPESKQRVALS